MKTTLKVFVVLFLLALASVARADIITLPYKSTVYEDNPYWYQTLSGPGAGTIQSPDGMVGILVGEGGLSMHSWNKDPSHHSYVSYGIGWTGESGTLVHITFDYLMQSAWYNMFQFGVTSNRLSGIIDGQWHHVDLDFVLDETHLSIDVANWGNQTYLENLNVYQVSPAPIPPSALLLGSGFLGLGALGWRRRKYC